MANLKNITDLPVAESAEGLNLIVNDNGSAKQIAASAVGAQADWAVTDENSPAFIKNKPVEEWDIDIVANLVKVTDDEQTWEYDIRQASSYDDIIAKLEAGINPRGRVIFNNLSCLNETTNDYHVYPMMAAGNGQGWEYWQDYGEVMWFSYSIDMFGARVFFNEDGSINIEAFFD